MKELTVLLLMKYGLQVMSASQDTERKIVWTISDAGTSNEISHVGNWNLLRTNNTVIRPSPRLGSASWDASGSQLWMFGGESQTAPGQSHDLLNDLWLYNKLNNTWSLVSHGNDLEKSPEGRKNAVCCGVQGIVLVVHGGQGHSGVILNDTWLYYFTTHSWLRLPDNATFPVIMSSAQAASWCFHDNMYIYGGLTSTTEVSKHFWRLSLNNFTWHRVPVNRRESVTPTGLHGASTWKHGDKLYMFGGASAVPGTTFNNLNTAMWEYSISQQVWENCDSEIHDYGKNTRPNGRLGALSWTDKSGNLLLYGGIGKNPAGNRVMYGDLWTFNISSCRWRLQEGADINSSLVVENELQILAELHIYNGLKANPGSRHGSISWSDNGTYHLFGGGTMNPVKSEVLKDDHWCFVLSPSDTFIAPGLTLSIVLAVITVLGLLVCLIVCLRKLQENKLCSCQQGERERYRDVKYSKVQGRGRVTCHR